MLFLVCCISSAMQGVVRWVLSAAVKDLPGSLVLYVGHNVETKAIYLESLLMSIRLVIIYISQHSYPTSTCTDSSYNIL